MAIDPATPLLLIVGPTAVGKSAIALRIAEQRGASILSADSMQVYRGLPIGTAQPSQEELARVPHHLVGHVEPGEEYHVARFVAEADEVIARERAAGRDVIVCGGTGLFLRHLVQGIFEGAPRDPALRSRLASDLEVLGPEAMRARLRAVDPEREAQINPNDTVRVLRALEVYESTGVPMSEWHRRDAASRRVRPVRFVVLDRPRAALFARIDARVDAMLAAGWVDEARALMSRGLPDNSQACKALGYRELFRHLRGEWGIGEAVSEVKKQTRRFAKRQLTWFRGVSDARWMDIDGMEPDEAADAIARSLTAE